MTDASRPDAPIPNVPLPNAPTPGSADADDRRWAAFWAVHSDLDREGPGNRASTARALDLVPNLPDRPEILDLGCGPGPQTLDLLDLTNGRVTAVDLHEPYLERLAAAARDRGWGDRLTTRAADMGALPFGPGQFDLIWAEGSAYCLGVEAALRTWRSLLKSGGAVALTEVTWRVADPPPEAREFWAAEYPTLQNLEENLAAIARAGYRIVGHFWLSESAWWDGYYGPLSARVDALRERFAGDRAALAVLDEHDREIDCFRNYSDAYGYAFFVAQPTA